MTRPQWRSRLSKISKLITEAAKLPAFRKLCAAFKIDPVAVAREIDASVFQLDSDLEELARHRSGQVARDLRQLEANMRAQASDLEDLEPVGDFAEWRV